MENYSFIFTDNWFVKYAFSMTEFLFLDLQNILSSGFSAISAADPNSSDFLDQVNTLSTRLMQPIINIENNIVEAALKAYNMKYLTSNSNPQKTNPVIKDFD